MPTNQGDKIPIVSRQSCNRIVQLEIALHVIIMEGAVAMVSFTNVDTVYLVILIDLPCRITARVAIMSLTEILCPSFKIQNFKILYNK